MVYFMPKIKTKSGAKKRFKINSNGLIKRNQAFKRHILTKKSPKTKRKLRTRALVHGSDVALVRVMLPYV